MRDPVITRSRGAMLVATASFTYAAERSIPATSTPVAPATHGARAVSDCVGSRLQTGLTPPAARRPPPPAICTPADDMSIYANLEDLGSLSTPSAAQRASFADTSLDDLVHFLTDGDASDLLSCHNAPHLADSSGR